MASIVIVGDAAMRARIAVSLAQRGQHPVATVADPAEVAGLALEASTILIFVCDVDAPGEIADLRRLCRRTGPAATVVIAPPATGAGVRRALDAGADALVFESELELTLAAAIQAVASGQSVVPRRLRASVERPSLSHRELEVLWLVRQGLTNAEIAARLFLAESTVKSHLASVFTKFGVHSRKEAAAVFTDLQRASGAAPAGSPPDSLEPTTA